MKNGICVALTTLSLLTAVSAQADCQPAYMKKVAGEGAGDPKFPLYMAPGIAADVPVIYGLAALGATSVALYSAITFVPIVIGGIVAIAIHEHKAHLLNMVRILDQADWMTGESNPPRATDKVSARELQAHEKAFRSFYLSVEHKLPGVTPMELATAISVANESGEFCNGVIQSNGRKARAGALASRGQTVRFFTRILK